MDEFYFETTLAMRSQAMDRTRMDGWVDGWRDLPEATRTLLERPIPYPGGFIDLSVAEPPADLLALGTSWAITPGDGQLSVGITYDGARRAGCLVFCAGPDCPMEVVFPIPEWPPEAAPGDPIYTRGWTIGGHYPRTTEPSTAELLEQLQWDSLEAADEPPPYAYIAGTGLLPGVSREEAIAAARGTPVFIYVGGDGVTEVIYTDG